MIKRNLRRICQVAKMAMFPKGWLDYLLSLASALSRSSNVWGMPTSLFIETSNYCNLKCPVCRTGNQSLKRPKGNMSFDNFKIIVNQIKSHVNTMALYFMGEPFLNPDIYKIIKYASENRIFTTICTNGELLDSNKVIESGLNEIWFQVGGLNNETHNQYRVGSDLGKIRENIITLNSLRRILKKELRIVIGLIVMKHNENQLKDFNNFWRNLQVDEGIEIMPRIYNYAHAKIFLPQNKKFNKYFLSETQDMEMPTVIRKLKNSCMWLWFCAEITWDGNVLPCCEDEEAQFIMGNVFKENLKTIWNNKKYKEFRRCILNSQNKIFICRSCLGMHSPLLN